jgi:hypothetical protein
VEGPGIAPYCEDSMNLQQKILADQSLLATLWGWLLALVIAG